MLARRVALTRTARAPASPNMVQCQAMTPAPHTHPWLLLALCACNGASTTTTDGTSEPTTGGTHAPTTSAAATSEPATTTAAPTTTSATSESPTTTDDPSTGGDEPGYLESPWGIASSHSSSQSLAAWAPQIATTGIDWLRGLDNADATTKLDIADASQLNVASILFYSKQSPASFPVDDIPGWQDHITTLLTETKGRVHHWEVWNEPPNFSDNKAPADYATIVQSAYTTAKAVDPTVQIGLAAQSHNVNFLDQALLAGAAGHFDYITVHPYEILDLVDDGWEAQYLSIVPTLRRLLAARDPGNLDAPIWFTEIGEPVDDKHTPEHQANTLIKAYTLALAQGVTRVHWFEGKDGDSGPFGLLDGDGNPRPSHVAMTTLITELGNLPHYRGWLLLNTEHYGFVFTRDATRVLVAWSRPGTTTDLQFATPVQIIDPLTGTALESTQHTLDTPTIFADIPADLAAQAQQNRSQPFPWGGDFTDAPSITYTAADGDSGLHPLGQGKIIMIDGAPARDISERPAQSFTVDPNFLSYDPAPIEIKATVRRNGAKPAGFNLKYESASGWTSTGGWNNVPGSDTWYEMTWMITDDQFVGKWGYNFAFDSDSTDNSAYSIQSVTVTKL